MLPEDNIKPEHPAGKIGIHTEGIIHISTINF